MKPRILVLNIVLILGFMAMVIILLCPLWAELFLESAQKSFDAGRLRDAIKGFEKTMKIDPFNSRYPAVFANNLIEGMDQKASTGLSSVEKAKELYGRALILNPRCAEYALEAGRTELVSFLKSKKQESAALALFHFERAIENDPKGFNILYSVGYASMSIWGVMNNSDKGRSLARLAHCIKLRPWYSRYIYKRVWDATKDFKALIKVAISGAEARNRLRSFISAGNVWKTAGDKTDIVSFFRQLERPQYPDNIPGDIIGRVKSLKSMPNVQVGPWIGKSFDGKHEIVDGKLSWTGTVYTILNMKPGPAKIIIKSKKYQVIDTNDPQDPKYFPQIEVRLDGLAIWELYVTNDEWDYYEFPIATDGGIKILSVSFINDIYDVDTGEDRNVQVGEVKVLYE